MIPSITIYIRRRQSGGWDASDDRSETVVARDDPREALLEWLAATTAAGLFMSDASDAADPPALPIESQPLKLVWPSDFKVYTQKFGMRPEFYSKFDLPGHEGVDIRAPSGSNIYACATGVVKLVAVNWRPGQAGRTAMHPYGYHVRLRHKRMDGEYETIYAHLTEGSAKVKEGEHVMAGQLIALADNTGNSSANHLHLSLKKIKPAGKKAAEPPAGLKLNQYILMGDGNILIDPALYLPAG